MFFFQSEFFLVVGGGGGGGGALGYKGEAGSGKGGSEFLFDRDSKCEKNLFFWGGGAEGEGWGWRLGKWRGGGGA